MFFWTWFFSFPQLLNWRIIMAHQKTQSQAVPANTTTNGSSASAENKFINHYISGSPIVYIYSMSDYFDKATGKTANYFNGNMKTGAKDGNNYIPVQGTLSPLARKELDAVFNLVNHQDPTQRMSVGVTVKAPRLEGVVAFLAKCDITEKGAIDFGNGDIKKPVAAQRLRLNNVENYKLFSKGGNKPGENDQAQAQGSTGGVKPNPVPAPMSHAGNTSRGAPSGWPQS
jgi:hypothetical protein